MPSKEALIESIVPGASLPIRDTMLKIYGYSVSDPEFEEIALARLELMGCTSAREMYKETVDGWKRWRDEQERGAAAWLLRQNENKETIWQLKTLNEKELKTLYRKLLTQGIVADPEQFAEMVIRYQ